MTKYPLIFICVAAFFIHGTAILVETFLSEEAIDLGGECSLCFLLGSLVLLSAEMVLEKIMKVSDNVRVGAIALVLLASVTTSIFFMASS